MLSEVYIEREVKRYLRSIVVQEAIEKGKKFPFEKLSGLEPC